MKCPIVKQIADELGSKLSKIGKVVRVGSLIHIRPTGIPDFKRFPQNDQSIISRWFFENGYLDASGKPFDKNDYRFQQSFYIKA